MKKRISFIAAVLAVVMLLAACGGTAATTAAPTTAAPKTEAPETEAPKTEKPETEAPETDAPETEAPETEAPETEAPETEAPETEAPETEAPETEAPETEAPETEAPETEGPEISADAPTAVVPYETVESYDDVKTYSFLMCWNGGAGAFPFGFNDGAIAKALEERTGVRLEAETIVSSEREKLAQVFMSGIVPDITNAPHWSTNPGGEGELIKNAAIDGLLLNLVGLYERFPNIVRSMTEGVSSVYLARDLEHPDYEGARYVIPTQTPRTDADVQNWAYGIFVRKDILEDLGYEPADINTQDKLYTFLTEIRDGGYVDINDRPVIPAGSWHNGWSSGLINGFSDLSATGWYVDEDGKVQNDIFADWQVDRLLYMRKLVNEGLFDVESLTHTDSVAREKASTGRVAVITGHYPHVRGAFQANLYLTNPEMEYVPVGPLQNDEGKIPTTWNRHGRTGSPVLFFNADIEEPERALNMVDFINSDEGLLLSSFGIEGTHYNFEDGIPVRTEEWDKISKEDPERYNLEGFGIGGQFIGADPFKGWGWDASYMEDGYVNAREFVPMQFFDGKTFDDLAQEWEGRKEYDELMSTINWGDDQKRAIAAESDEAAIEILENYRNRMLEAGMEEMIAYIQAAYDEDPSIIY